MLNQESILDKININNSYMISGIAGSGKTTLAYAILSKVIEEVTPEHAHTFKTNNYPDFHNVIGGKTEDIQDLLSKLNKKPFYKKHFVLIDEIDKVSIEGQNLLLKTLEESDVFFVLVSNNNSKVLKTLFSRTYKIIPNPLSRDIILDILNKEYSNHENYSVSYARRISLLCNGSLGKSKKYMENSNLKDFILDLDDISNKNFFILASKYKDCKEEKEEIFYLIENYIRNIMISSDNKKECFDLTVKLYRYKKELIHNANLQMIYQNIFTSLIKLSN